MRPRWELAIVRYFFDVSDSPSTRDEVGMELPDAAAARLHALSYLGAILKDADSSFLESDEPVVVTVRDEQGHWIVRVEVHARPIDGA